MRTELIEAVTRALQNQPNDDTVELAHNFAERLINELRRGSLTAAQAKQLALLQEIDLDVANKALTEARRLCVSFLGLNGTGKSTIAGAILEHKACPDSHFVDCLITRFGELHSEVDGVKRYKLNFVPDYMPDMQIFLQLAILDSATKEGSVTGSDKSEGRKPQTLTSLSLVEPDGTGYVHLAHTDLSKPVQDPSSHRLLSRGTSNWRIHPADASVAQFGFYMQATAMPEGRFHAPDQETPSLIGVSETSSSDGARPLVCPVPLAAGLCLVAVLVTGPGDTPVYIELRRDSPEGPAIVVGPEDDAGERRLVVSPTADPTRFQPIIKVETLRYWEDAKTREAACKKLSPPKAKAKGEGKASQKAKLMARKTKGESGLSALKNAAKDWISQPLPEMEPEDWGQFKLTQGMLPCSTADNTTWLHEVVRSTVGTAALQIRRRSAQGALRLREKFTELDERKKQQEQLRAAEGDEQEPEDALPESDLVASEVGPTFGLTQAETNNALAFNLNPKKLVITESVQKVLGSVQRFNIYAPSATLAFFGLRNTAILATMEQPGLLNDPENPDEDPVVFEVPLCLPPNLPELVFLSAPGIHKDLTPFQRSLVARAARREADVGFIVIQAKSGCGDDVRSLLVGDNVQGLPPSKVWLDFIALKTPLVVVFNPVHGGGNEHNIGHIRNSLQKLIYNPKGFRQWVRCSLTDGHLAASEGHVNMIMKHLTVTGGSWSDDTWLDRLWEAALRLGVAPRATRAQAALRTLQSEVVTPLTEAVGPAVTLFELKCFPEDVQDSCWAAARELTGPRLEELAKDLEEESKMLPGELQDLFEKAAADVASTLSDEAFTQRWDTDGDGVSALMSSSKLRDCWDTVNLYIYDPAAYLVLGTLDVITERLFSRDGEVGRGILSWVRDDTKTLLTRLDTAFENVAIPQFAQDDDAYSKLWDRFSGKFLRWYYHTQAKVDLFKRAGALHSKMPDAATGVSLKLMETLKHIPLLDPVPVDKPGSAKFKPYTEKDLQAGFRRVLLGGAKIQGKDADPRAQNAGASTRTRQTTASSQANKLAIKGVRGHVFDEMRTSIIEQGQKVFQAYRRPAVDLFRKHADELSSSREAAEARFGSAGLARFCRAYYVGLGLFNFATGIIANLGGEAAGDEKIREVRKECHEALGITPVMAGDEVAPVESDEGSDEGVWIDDDDESEPAPGTSIPAPLAPAPSATASGPAAAPVVAAPAVPVVAAPAAAVAPRPRLTREQLIENEMTEGLSTRTRSNRSAYSDAGLSLEDHSHKRQPTTSDDGDAGPSNPTKKLRRAPQS
eukprot:tig00020553_g10620.t1